MAFSSNGRNEERQLIEEADEINENACKEEEDDQKIWDYLELKVDEAESFRVDNIVLGNKTVTSLGIPKPDKQPNRFPTASGSTYPTSIPWTTLGSNKQQNGIPTTSGNGRFHEEDSGIFSQNYDVDEINEDATKMVDDNPVCEFHELKEDETECSRAENTVPGNGRIHDDSGNFSQNGLEKYATGGRRHKLMHTDVSKLRLQLMEYIMKLKPSDCLEIQGFKIFKSDMLLLISSGWIKYTVTDPILSLTAQKFGNVVALKTIREINGIWNIRDAYDRIRNIRDLRSYTWMFAPILQNQHWVLLVADIQSRKACVLDSARQPVYNNHKEIFNSFCELMEEAGHGGGWEELKKHSAEQKDHYNCGAFLLMNVFAIIWGINPATLKTSHAEKMRVLVMLILLHYRNQ